MASRSSDGRRYYFGLIRGTKHRFYDPESPIIAPESEPISETGSLETRSSSGESTANLIVYAATSMQYRCEEDLMGRPDVAVLGAHRRHVDDPTFNRPDDQVGGQNRSLRRGKELWHECLRSGRRRMDGANGARAASSGRAPPLP